MKSIFIRIYYLLLVIIQTMNNVIFGTYRLKGELLEELLLRAIELGITNIDTASLYGNEKTIGNVLNSINKNNIYNNTNNISITTKVNNKDMYKNKVYSSYNKSLKKLYKIDTLLLHNPVNYIECWNEMININVNDNVNIGTSNFMSEHLNELLEVYNINNNTKPTINQIEYHPYNCQINKVNETLDYCKEEGIEINFHSIFCRGKVRELVRDDIDIYSDIVGWIMSKDYKFIIGSSSVEQLDKNIGYIEYWKQVENEFNNETNLYYNYDQLEVEDIVLY